MHASSMRKPRPKPSPRRPQGQAIAHRLAGGPKLLIRRLLRRAAAGRCGAIPDLLFTPFRSSAVQPRKDAGGITAGRAKSGWGRSGASCTRRTEERGGARRQPFWLRRRSLSASGWRSARMRRSAAQAALRRAEFLPRAPVRVFRNVRDPMQVRDLAAEEVAHEEVRRKANSAKLLELCNGLG